MKALVNQLRICLQDVKSKWRKYGQVGDMTRQELNKVEKAAMCLGFGDRFGCGWWVGRQR